MGPGENRPVTVRGSAATWLAVLDLTAKVVLLMVVVRVGLDPAWGNLEGKAPGTRALTYPLLALLVPALFVLRPSPGRYPWGADLLVTLPGFSDLLGNRLDLYDRVLWFDDLVHVANTGLLSAAILVLCGAAHAPVWRRLELAVASGMTLSLAWELWEYYAFVTRSGEAATAYADTVGDLVLGWAGAVVAALVVATSPQEAGEHDAGTTPDGARRLSGEADVGHLDHELTTYVEPGTP